MITFDGGGTWQFEKSKGLSSATVVMTKDSSVTYEVCGAIADPTTETFSSYCSEKQYSNSSCIDTKLSSCVVRSFANTVDSNRGLIWDVSLTQGNIGFAVTLKKNRTEIMQLVLV